MSDDRDALAARARASYETGLTVVQVAAEIGFSYGKTYALIKEGGGEIRARGSKFVVANDETT